MDENKVKVKKETVNASAKNDKNIENKNKINSDTNHHRDIENTINEMLDQVMEDPDDTNSNSNNIKNTLQFNDDESNEDDIIDAKMNHHFFPNHFDRSNKRLKTVINNPVNIPNFPIMNINPYNFNNNFSSIKTPSFGYVNYNDNGGIFYNKINSLNNNNNYIGHGHKSSNNLVKLSYSSGLIVTSISSSL